MSQTSKSPVFLPLGDSYTICEGLKESERWPNLIEVLLKENKTPVTLADNPARTGYTTSHLIKIELPLLKKIQPDIVTILIGVNDYVQGYDTAYFHSKLSYILDAVQKELKKQENIILISIPDYSVTPGGAYYAQGKNVSEDLKMWNSIIESESVKRKLPFVDIFPLSQKMKDDPELTGSDGLHPSAAEVALWARLIYPEMEKLVRPYY